MYLNIGLIAHNSKKKINAEFLYRIQKYFVKEYPLCYRDYRTPL